MQEVGTRKSNRATRAALPLLIMAAVPLLGGCAKLMFAAPAPIARAPVQDANAILQTMQSPRVAQSAPAKQAARAPLDQGTLGANASMAGAMVSALPAIPEAAAPMPQAKVPLYAAQTLVPTLPPQRVQVSATVEAAPTVHEVQGLLENWRQAWERGDASNYLKFYDGNFKGDARSREEWERQREARLANGNIRVAIGNVRVMLKTSDEAEVRFLQHYSSGRHSDMGEKRMRVRRDGDAWRIVHESWATQRA